MVHFIQNMVKNSIFYLFVIVMGLNLPVTGQTWTPLTNLAPHYSGGVMLLLTDGTVISKSIYGGFGSSPGTTWDKLTPDSTGNYINGTWSTISLMNNDRLYFSSWVLPDGRVYVGGGEYGASAAAEMYDPVANTWTSLTTPSGVDFQDGVSENLPDGKLLLGAVSPPNGVYIYDPVANSYATGAFTILPHDEVAWLKLPDSSILQVDLFLTSTERYIPASNTWITDAAIPVQLYDSFDLESGAALLLPNGKGFFVGATGHTAFYTPSGNTSAGTWTTGPDLPGGYSTPDAPMAMLSNGKILMAVSPKPHHSGDFPAPTHYYEFDYTTNTFTDVYAPSGADSLNLPTYMSNMLVLPDGSVLYQPAGSKRYYEYTSGGSPLTAGKPTVSSISRNNCDTFTVTGTLFTGISEGAAYGDDWAMSTNYPIIKINSGTRSWYAKSFNWNRPGSVMTGSAADTVTFALPAGLTPGSYTLQVIVNGNPSATTSFNTAITITPSTATICTGSSTTLAAATGSGIWSSSNTGVATAGLSSGTVSGISAGTATITYTTGGCIATAPVSVTALSSITASAGSNGSISPSGVTNVCPGSNEAYNINPNTGYHITGVTVDGSSLGVISTYTFSPVTSGSHIISATFAVNSYTLTASSGTHGSISPTGTSIVSYGASHTYNMTPAAGYHVSDITIDGSSAGAATIYTFGTISASHTISVSFAINTYTITETSDTNGITAPTGITSVNYGDNQTYTMTPNTGYSVADVQVDGVSVGQLSSYTFYTVDANHTIHTDYAVSTFEIDSWSDGGSSISPDGSTILNYGDTQTYTMSANPGYYITNVDVDGTDIGYVTSYTFYSVSDYHFIYVNSTLDTFVITASSDTNGTFSPSGSTTVNYGDDLTYTISPNTGSYISDVTVDGVSAGAVSSYTFSSISANHIISATFAINTYSIIATSGANGSVSPSGTTTVSYGGSQTYTITPATGYYISDVTVDGVSAGAVSSYTFSSLSANHTISATFAINTYSIIATSGANGSVSPSGTTTVSYGGSQTYTITPATGYYISDVTVDGVSAGAVSSYTFSSVSANHTISASFAIYTYSISSASGANGSVSPSGTSTVSYGGSQTYTITSATGYYISDVTVDGVSAGAVSSYTFSSVSANHTISASFAIYTYSITATSGANGTVTPSGTTTISYGGNQTYIITPSSGYYISGVTVDGVSAGTSGTYSFSSVSANHTISAAFAIYTYSITATSGANGSVSPSGTTMVSYGGSQTYTITPVSGYAVSGVTVDGSVAGTGGTYTFSSVSANHTISASFVSTVYTITATSGPNGSITPFGISTSSFGSSPIYIMVPNTGYHISDVQVDGMSVGAVSSYTFSSISSSHTISVSFAINSYNLTSYSGSNGTISPSGTSSVLYGGSLAYTMVPNTGYHIDYVVIDGYSIGAVSTYTFTSVNSSHTIAVNFAINNYTITATSGPNGSITPSGTATSSYGSSPIYIMTPNTGYHIADVNVDGTSAGAVSSYIFSSISANHTISVTFAINSYSLTAYSGANGSISPSGTSSVIFGGSQAYSMIPNTGYHVDYIVVDGSNIGAVSSYTFTSVNSNHTIASNFAINNYSVTATAGANGTITPSGTSVSSYGSSPIYIMSANAGYVISNVIVDGVSVGAASSYTFSSISANHTISVTFAAITYNIVASSGPNGTISPSGTTVISSGGSQTYTIAPASGYSIAGVRVDGVSAGTGSTYTFSSVTASHTISASFAVITYTISASAGSHGSISPSGSTVVSSGGSQAYSMTPSGGYHISGVTVDGSSLGSVSSYTFSSVAANHSISVSFAINTYTITSSSGPNGSISPSGSSVVSSGGSQTYSMTPASGYHVSNVTVDGSSAGAVSSYTFSSVTTNHTISVSFAINTYTITASSGSHGSISPTGTTIVSSGGSQTYTFSPSSSYYISNVTVDGTSIGSVTTYTFSSVTANHIISVSFARDYSIIASTGPHGSVSPSGTTYVSPGGSQTYSISPNLLYAVSGVTVDGVSVGTVTTYTFSSVSANHTISATFALLGLKNSSSTDSTLKTYEVPSSFSVKIYPNPGSGDFNVVIPDEFDQASIMVSDLSGRVIASREVADNHGTPIQINLGSQASGAYIIKVISGTESFTTKLIKE